MARYLLPLTLLPLLASCVAAPRPPAPVPSTPPPVVVRPAPAPAPVVDRYNGDWSVDDLSPGEWQTLPVGRTDAAPTAAFVDATGQSQAVIGCAAGQLTIGRYGNADPDRAVSMSVRTSFTLRELPAQLAAVRLPPETRVRASHVVRATLDARDPLWDQIIYSRGRFLIEASGMAPLIVPTRPETARVIEQCRAGGGPVR